MKLLVLAHVPPPFHGQSFMVQQMLEGFGGDYCDLNKVVPADASNHKGIECHHVNSVLSSGMSDVGAPRLSKLLPLVRWALQTRRCAKEHGIENLYYVPAPGKGAPVIRDCILLSMIRHKFKRVIFHWHAAGLGEWVENRSGSIAGRWLRRLYRKHDLSIVLSDFNRKDIEVFDPPRVAVVNNGISDPWEGNERSLFEERFLREQELGALFQRASKAGGSLGGRPVKEVKLLYLGHLTRSKGLVDALEAVRIVNAHVTSSGIPVTVRLFVGGDFASESDRVEIGPILRDAEENQYASRLGFVSGTEKLKLLQESDAMLFPTRYENENQPVVILEALSVGLPIITTRWRSIPELLPVGYPWLAPPGAPDELAATIIKFLAEPKRLKLREHFLQCFTLEKHLSSLSKEMHALEHSPARPEIAS